MHLLAGNLSANSQAVRRATLGVLCAVPLARDDGQGGDGGGGGGGTGDNVLHTLLRIESQPCTLEAGRGSAAALVRITGQLEYGQLPQLLLRPVVQSLLGILHIRCGLGVLVC